jgi:hypothetical protein
LSCSPGGSRVGRRCSFDFSPAENPTKPTEISSTHPAGQQAPVVPSRASPDPRSSRPVARPRPAVFGAFWRSPVVLALSSAEPCWRRPATTARPEGPGALVKSNGPFSRIRCPCPRLVKPRQSLVRAGFPEHEPEHEAVPKTLSLFSTRDPGPHVYRGQRMLPHFETTGPCFTSRARYPPSRIPSGSESSSATRDTVSPIAPSTTSRFSSGWMLQVA